LEQALSPATGWDFNFTESSKAKGKSIFLTIDTTIVQQKEAYH